MRDCTTDERPKVPGGQGIPKAKTIFTTPKGEPTQLGQLSQMEAMKRFMVMQTPFFNGEPNAKAVENQLRHMKRILVRLGIPEDRRVSLAAYMLVDKADI